MCGIVGIYRKSGITAKDIEKFTEMLVRCESRGTDATGAFNDSLDPIKYPSKASSFVKTKLYRKFKASSVGSKYVIGHTRQATRGSPKKNRNNHPVYDKKAGIYLVHNGMVSCEKWDFTPKNTDTYIFVNCLATYRPERPSLYDTVKDGVEDIYSNARYDSSVIVVADTNEIVFCKTETRPLAIQKKDDALYFASTEDIMGLEVLEIKENGDKVIDYFDLNNHSIVGVHLVTGDTRSDILKTYPFPKPLTSRHRLITKPVVKDLKAFNQPKVRKQLKIELANVEIEQHIGEATPMKCSLHRNGLYLCYDCYFCQEFSVYDGSDENLEEWIEDTEVYCTLMDDAVKAGEGRDCVNFTFGTDDMEYESRNAREV